MDFVLFVKRIIIKLKQVLLGKLVETRNMDLKDFIAKSLVSIDEGVKEANSGDRNCYLIGARPEVINFDVAVEIGKEGSNTKGGGLHIQVVKAEIGGSSKTKESHISRINFTIGVKKTIQ